jgi:hypothetical protein
MSRKARMLTVAGIAAGAFVIAGSYAIIGAPDDESTMSAAEPASEEIEVLTATPASDGSVTASSTKSAAAAKGTSKPAAVPSTAAPTVAPPATTAAPPDATVMPRPVEPRPLRPPAQPFVK